MNRILSSISLILLCSTSRGTTAFQYGSNVGIRRVVPSRIVSSDRTSNGIPRYLVSTSSPPPRHRSLKPSFHPSPHLLPLRASELDSAEEDHDHVYQTALTNTLLAILSSSLFGIAIWHYMGPIASQEFFAGYLVEQSLSVDNLFVFLLLFDYFRVPLPYQNRVLNWGIMGAIVMRAIMISLGSAALQHFHAVLLLFAAILVYSSGKVLIGLFGGGEEEEEDVSENSIVKFSRALLPTTDHFDGDRFFTMVDGAKVATPLLLCMVAVEISDVVFAVDSIPAVFGVTENPIIVFTSNIFAILGLRSLYTILSKAASDLKYLEPSVAIVLGFIGLKMILEYFGMDIPTSLALGVVVSLLTGGVGLSVWEKRRDLKEGVEILEQKLEEGLELSREEKGEETSHMEKMEMSQKEELVESKKKL